MSGVIRRNELQVRFTAEHVVHVSLTRVLLDRPRVVQENVYRERGDVENRIKELHHGLEIDPTSCTRFPANRLRVLMTAATYVLTQELRAQREACERGTNLDGELCVQRRNRRRLRAKHSAWGGLGDRGDARCNTLQWSGLTPSADAAAVAADPGHLVHPKRFQEIVCHKCHTFVTARDFIFTDYPKR